MKKLFIITLMMVLAISGSAQQLHYDFSKVVESGQTLYFLKRDYAPQEVWVTYPCFEDYYGDGDHITTFYYGHEKPTGDLVIPSTVTHNDTVYTVTRIDFSAFYECADLTSVVFPSTLTFIGQRAFLSCHGLSGEIVIPDAVTIIGTNAFFYCNNITSVVFGSSLQEIRGLAFGQCYSLAHISCLPESLKVLDDGAFDRCYPLCDSIIIPPQITVIEEDVFASCHIPSVVIPEGVTTIKSGAFTSCPIRELHIPATLTSINIGAIYTCNRIQSITVHENNPVYDSRGNCNALINTATNTLLKGCKNTVIPDDITTIGQGAFYSINDLSSIHIPSSVERLEPGAFSGCNSLTTITLPSSISYIGENALSCNGLTSIVCKASIPPTAINQQWEYGYDNSFMGVNRDIPVYIPIGTIDAYLNAPGWDYFNYYIDSEMNLEGEWYYEIQNDDGSITYQHLEAEGDTVVQGKRPKIIIRSNTQYDRDTLFTVVTHEYVYEENGVVYWWNKDLEEFTTLYHLNAQVGDEWTIQVGNESLIMHVDGVDSIVYEGRTIRQMHVSDADDLFSGDIVCGIGHLTSFFPERLMNQGKGYRVEGMRCYWVNGNLFFKIGDKDCDAVYDKIHFGVEEDGPSAGSGTLVVYPNPTDGVLFVETHGRASLSNQTYRISNLMGQTMMTGVLDVRLPQCDSPTTIDVSNLPAGMYFISVGGQTMKFVVR